MTVCSRIGAVLLVSLVSFMPVPVASYDANFERHKLRFAHSLLEDAAGEFNRPEGLGDIPEAIRYLRVVFLHYPDVETRPDFEGYVRQFDPPSAFLKAFEEARTWADRIDDHPTEELFQQFRQYREKGPWRDTKGEEFLGSRLYRVLSNRDHVPAMLMEADYQFAEKNDLSGVLILSEVYEKGYAEPALELGRRFEEGDGVDRSPLLAFYWTALAAKVSKDQDLYELLERRKEFLTPREEVTARKMLRFVLPWPSPVEP